MTVGNEGTSWNGNASPRRPTLDAGEVLVLDADAEAGGGLDQRDGNPGMQPKASSTSPCDPDLDASAMQVVKGIAVSPGIAIGPVVVLDPLGMRLPPRKVAPEALAAELVRLEEGLAAAGLEAAQAEADARHRLGPQYADILAAHARMITDETLRVDARARIERYGISAEHAVIEVLETLASRLDQLSDPHLSARAADVRDIQGRIVGQLIGQRPKSFQEGLAAPSVAVAHDLTPSEAAQLDPDRVLGFATEAGGQASHTAIVAAALEIPAVVGLGSIVDRARSARLIVIDGDEGLVVLNPDAPTLERYRAAAVDRSARYRVLSEQAGLPAETLDGVRVELFGNIEFVDEVAACLKWGAAGVGLYRTEFLYLRAPTPPTEEEQYQAYSAVIRSLQGKPIIIRTLDLGADKLTSYRGAGSLEANPVLGLRSLRFSLRHPELFRTQLRALLRAAVQGDVRILFPLVSTLDELRRARAVVGEVAAELRAEGHSLRDAVPLGVMVEVPAAALMADQFAKEVDFFSIGTNDLIQYTLAVDRTNETVADLYSAADPSVLRLIAMVVEAAEKRGIEVSVCGSMGGEPLYALFLLGLGLRSLSMPPHQLPEVRRVIRGARLDAARVLAAEALRLDTAREVVALLEAALRPILTNAKAMETPTTSR
ncbi:phosphoenolpyruvate--protein phosphotransferase [Paludisphaera borealis]|uniref:Phosphoenolpyruvate-protein phosphotransferase n=1 Tax=Paludisphaera borealis TaxID=1387353 RepID=A0A1U7CTU2_9BACT|nr:phosphoenolpyruvate--protein phosphotransferase [Paludisphaera borealis]APW62293.1 Phosphoenolpyruvate-protein phosphotransferase [Paludisphaera borealis]